jgi:hypothetical protein
VTTVVDGDDGATDPVTTIAEEENSDQESPTTPEANED